MAYLGPVWTFLFRTFAVVCSFRELLDLVKTRAASVKDIPPLHFWTYLPDPRYFGPYILTSKVIRCTTSKSSLSSDVDGHLMRGVPLDLCLERWGTHFSTQRDGSSDDPKRSLDYYMWQFGISAFAFIGFRMQPSGFRILLQDTMMTGEDAERGCHGQACR